MHFDDRLATVLHHRAAGERAARVQFRQLLDLLGEPDVAADPILTRAAYRRLDALALLIPVGLRERIATECSARIRNRQLLAWLAGSEPRIALAALSRAMLADEEWTALIPELPVRARGLLRHRRNLPRVAQQLLDRLGVQDRILPEPDPRPADGPIAPTATEPGIDARPALDLGRYAEELYVFEPGEPSTAPLSEPPPPRPSAVPDSGDLGALVRRIEEFQRARERRSEAARGDAPLLPLGGPPAEEPALAQLKAFLFTTDEAGRIDWAEPAAAALVVGTRLADDGARSQLSGAFAQAFALRRPVGAAALNLSGAEQVTGQWLVDATPRFAPRGGQFTGYVGRVRRPAPAPADTRAARAADLVRQLLHELRTPVTAIQGFAEVIQQQTVGAVPHEYRALAAAIAGDAARMLAGFAELERLAGLEAGTQELTEGTADFLTIARRQVAQLQTVLSPRVSRIDAEWQVREAKVALAPDSAEMLAWRFLGTLAAATAAGERLELEMAAVADMLRLQAVLPAALAQAEDVFAGDIRPAVGALGTGLFGAGFALRLARAEARAAGGDLVRSAPGRMVLTLPLAQAPAANGDTPHRAAARAGS